MPYILYHEPLSHTPPHTPPPPTPTSPHTPPSPLNGSNLSGRDGSEVKNKGHSSPLPLLVEPTSNSNPSFVSLTAAGTREKDGAAGSSGGGPIGSSSSSSSSGGAVRVSSNININTHTNTHTHHDSKPPPSETPIMARIAALLSACMSGWGMFYMGIFIALPMFILSLAVSVVFGTIVGLLTYPVYAVRRLYAREYPWPDAVTSFGKSVMDQMSRWTTWCGSSSGSGCCHHHRHHPQHPSTPTTTRSIWPCFRGQGLAPGIARGQGPGIAQGQGLGPGPAPGQGLAGRPRGTLRPWGLFGGGHWFRGNNSRRAGEGDHHPGLGFVGSSGGVLGRPVVQSSSSASLTALNGTLALAALNQRGSHGPHTNGGAGGGAGIGLRLGMGSGLSPVTMTSVVNGGANR